IARLVLREEQAARVRQAAAIDTMRGQPQTSAAAEAMTRCFGECLGRLSPAQRELLLAYYEGEKSQRIENRARQAAALGITLNNLRNRALRLRERVEACTRQCIQGKSS